MGRFFASGQEGLPREPGEPWSLALCPIEGRIEALVLAGSFRDPIVIDGRTFRHRWTADDSIHWNPVTNGVGRMVGFVLDSIRDPNTLANPLATESEGVSIVDYGPKHRTIRLCPDRSSEGEDEGGLLGFPVEFFEDEQGKLLVWLGCMECWVGYPDRLSFARTL